MNKVYLFVYGNSLGNRDEVRKIIDSIPQITNWRYDIPNCFYIHSSSSAVELVDLIKAKLNEEKVSFFITEITGNYEGYLSKETWDFIAIK